MAGTVTVRGLRELQLGLKKADAEFAKKLRGTLREVAEPVRRDAEQLAGSEIANMTPAWSRMRIGVTAKTVYVVPKSRRRGGSPRANLGPLLIDRALDPALEQNEPGIILGVQRLLDNAIDHNL